MSSIETTTSTVLFENSSTNVLPNNERNKLNVKSSINSKFSEDSSILNDRSTISRKSSTISAQKITKKEIKKKVQTPCKVFRKAIPRMPKPLAILCCIANIFLPGSGNIFLRVLYFIFLFQTET